MNKSLLENKALHLLLIVLAGVCVYANSLHVPFVFDDQPSITGNALVHDLNSFLQGNYPPNPRRYVGYLTFALNYRFFGLDVVGYHLVNLAIHLSCALMAYALTGLLLKTPFFKGKGGEEGAGYRLLPLFVALLFLLHPVQTQAVTYTVQRLTSLMTLFFLSAVTLYLFSRLTSRRGARTAAYLGALVCTLLAMKTKENAFTLPVIVVLLECFFLSGEARRRALLLIPFLLTMLVIPLSMVDLHKEAGQLLSDVSEATQLEAPLSRLGYLCTEFRVIVTYLRLLFFPVNQTLDYDFPLYRSFFQGPVLISFLFLLFLCAGAVILWHRSGRDAASLDARYLRLISFGTLWFFVTLSVESSVIPIIDVIYEHRVYLPSYGAFLAIGTALFAAAALLPAGRRRALPYAAAGLLLIFGGATVTRNNVWGDSVVFWNDVVQKAPGKVRGYNNLGVALAAAGREEEAIGVLRTALTVKPDHPEAYYNLGRILVQRPGEEKTAIALLSTALKLKPNYDDARINLGAAYIRLRQPAEALKVLDSVSADAMDRADRHFNLGVAYAALGALDKAQGEVFFLQKDEPQLAQQLDAYLATLMRQPAAR